MYADAQPLQQVLLNPVGNAIKFSKKESASVRISAEQEAQYVIVSVTDDGVGIPQDEVEHIFEPFVLIDNAPQGSTKGTGLGLAICQSMVEQHGRSIWVESEEGVGSRFSFSLPCSPSYITPGPHIIFGPRQESSPSHSRRSRDEYSHSVDGLGLNPQVHKSAMQYRQRQTDSRQSQRVRLR